MKIVRLHSVSRTVSGAQENDPLWINFNHVKYLTKPPAGTEFPGNPNGTRIFFIDGSFVDVAETENEIDRVLPNANA